MDRRRMMMGGGGKCVVALSFSEDTASGTYVEYKGLQNRSGEFECKKNDVIKCVCVSAAPRAPVAILFDGTVKAQGIGSALWEHKVESNLVITATGSKLEITTEK